MYNRVGKNVLETVFVQQVYHTYLLSKGQMHILNRTRNIDKARQAHIAALDELKKEGSTSK